MKERILHKASELFMRVGFKNTTMDDICSELGISKKTLYTYYSRKNDLIKDVAYGFVSDLNQKIDKVLDSEVKPILELHVVREVIRHNFGGKQNITSEFQLQKYYPQIYKKIIKDQFEINFLFIKNNLKKGIEQGYYRKELDVDYIATLYFYVVHSFFKYDNGLIEKYGKDESVDKYLDYHIRAISTPRGVEYLENKLENELTNYKSNINHL